MKRYYNPLINACRQNYLGRIRFLLDNGADPNLQEPRYGWNALMWALYHGRTDVVRLLLDHGADPNLQTKHGRTALMIASHLDKIGLVQELLDRGADPNLRDDDGRTALWWASDRGQTEVVKLIWGWTIVKPLIDLGIFPEGLIREHLTI
jgi:ankyrin repeat protein